MKCYSARYCTAILLSVGLAIIYGLKVNYHVTVVAMVNHTAMMNEESNVSSHQESEDGPFLWSSTVRGLQLSAYFWGYMVGQLPGGRVSELYSAKWTFFFGVTINVIFTLLTPFMAHVHPGAVVLSRAMEGIGGGVSFPATHTLLARWSPPLERSIMSSISYAGTAAGTVIFTLVSGLIAGTIGWKWVFYIEGGLSSIWLIVWSFLVTDYPEQQTLMSDEEREYMNNSFKDEVPHGHTHLKVPWRAVFTSIPFWSIMVAHICSNWGWYMILTELPTYMKDILEFNIKENAVLSSIPYLCMFIFSLVLGQLIDVLRLKGMITTTFGRKLATSIASFLPCLCFCALCFITDPVPAVILMTISITAIGGMYCGFLSNHIDISPNFAGTLMASTNTVASVPGIIVPIFVGWLCDQDPSIKSWRIVFLVTIVLYIIEFLTYVVFGTGNLQEWNKAST